MKYYEDNNSIFKNKRYISSYLRKLELISFFIENIKVVRLEESWKKVVSEKLMGK